MWDWLKAKGRLFVDSFCDEIWLYLSLTLAVICVLVTACFAPVMLIRWLRGRPATQPIHGEDGSLYLWRLFLTPRTWLGGLYWHVFHRGDEDRDPHDHPWAFLTFPLTSYYEVVLHADGRETLEYVKAFRWHYRPASYRHRVIGTKFEQVESEVVLGFEADYENGGTRQFKAKHRTWVQAKGDRKLYTLVYHGPKAGNWGFWVFPKFQYAGSYCDNGEVSMRRKVPWRLYNH